MRNIKLTLSYDGTAFLGWQKTPLGPTIEESLESALGTLLQTEVSLQAASRTDAGVHAEGQIVNFLLQDPSISLARIQKSLNALLPPSIVVVKIEEALPLFHPTLDAQGKEYHYLVCNTPFQQPKHRFFSWHVPFPLDKDAMQRAALPLLGTHPFSAFCNLYKTLDKDPVCTLSVLDILSLDEGRLCFKLIGNRFLFRMARNLVGTLVHVGRGKIDEDATKEILLSEQRAKAGMTAPAHGLHLMRVFYQNSS